MADATPLAFIDKDRRFEVLIMPDAIAAMVSAATKAGRKETGGILIGRLENDGATAVVFEATSKPRDSSFGWSWFQRGARGLKALLARRWAEGSHYLGEWHYHPFSSPLPSGSDRTAMADISGDGRYCCPEPVLAIIGGDRKSVV